MKRILIALAALIVILGLAFVGAATFLSTKERPVPEEVAGYTIETIAAAHRDEDLEVHIWYPAEPGTGETILLAQNALFYGRHVAQDATAKDGAHPVVVISHGSGGNSPQLGWLATHLATSGYVVIGTNHPGTRSRDSDPHQSVQFWNRNADLTAMLDLVEAGLPQGISVDSDKIATLGFSLGGASILSLSGVGFAKQNLITYCATIPDEWDCGWYNENGVDFAALDEEKFDAAYQDARISAAIVVDPAFVQVADPASLSDITMPVLLINMANDGLVPSAMLAEGLAEGLPNATYHVIPKAWHFSFLAECSPFGKMMIWALSPDNICGDLRGRTRPDVHNEVNDVVLTFLGAELGN